MPQVYNQAVLFSFSAAVSPQQLEQRINVPFKVGKVVFHPPMANVLAADSKTECYFIQSDLNRNGVGIVGGFSGTRDAAVANSPMVANARPIVVVYNQPTDVSGLHLFSLRCFSEAGGGAAVPITAKVWLQIEFHEFV